jgi:hypothetical protein
MNIKLKRSVRTPHSEEIDIFDGDTHDEAGDAVNIGKLEVHYLSDQVVGTLLIWQEYAQGFNRIQDSRVLMDDLIDAILTEVTEPIGVSSEYGIEIYFPSVINHSFASNYTPDADDLEDEEPTEEDGEESEDEDTEDTNEGTQPRDDDYHKKLAQRP